MKKNFLLLACGLIAITANGQRIKQASSGNNLKKIPFVASASHVASLPTTHSGARTTTTTFWTEDFSSGTHTTMPTGWTSGTISGPGTWRWTEVASTSAYTIGALASTTASNGWMIFDSDSLGAVCGTCAPAGWLQSPVVNCSAHPSVKLSFQEKFREFNDSCFIWVSNNGGTTWTSFQVLPNDGLAGNVSTANPQVVSVNISTVAAGQASVIFRFVYNGEAAAGGGYSWLVDDVNMSELDPHDVGAGGSFMYEPELTAYNGSIFTTPLAFVDSFYPVTLLTNYGANSETNVAVNADIYSGTTSIYTNSVTEPSLPVSAYDSVIQFPGYKPTAIGNYMCTFSTTVTGDAVSTNNVDTVHFNVSDTIWQENLGVITGSYYVYDAATHASYFQGTRFDVPSSSAGDTISGFGVAFGSSSVPTNTGGTVTVQLYSIQQSGTGWVSSGASFARAITSADISSTTSTTWAYFGIDTIASGGVSAFVLQPGTTYAAMVQVNGVTTNLLVDATPAPNATGYCGYFGQSDTSYNDGAATFAPSTTATGNASAVPLVRMYFGPVTRAVSHVGISNVNNNISVGNAFPNPANTNVSVPFTMQVDANITATLSNTIGQVLSVQQISATAGKPGKVTFETSALADGIYLYNLEINGQHSTGRIAVSH